MHLLIHSLLALATGLPTFAFTNGSLIPAYFCNPVPDGLPKSLGELIPFTVKDQCAPFAFNANGKFIRHLQHWNLSNESLQLPKILQFLPSRAPSLVTLATFLLRSVSILDHEKGNTC